VEDRGEGRKEGVFQIRHQLLDIKFLVVARGMESDEEQNVAVASADLQGQDLEAEEQRSSPCTPKPKSENPTILSSIPAHKLSALKHLIDGHLRSANVYEEIRRFVAEFAAKKATSDENDTSDVYSSLHERKIIGEIIRTLDMQLEEEKGVQARADVKPGNQYLMLSILRGRGLPSSHDSDGSEGESEGKRRTSFVVKVHFGDERFESKSIPCSEEAVFDTTFLLEISDRFALGQGSQRVQMKGLHDLLTQNPSHLNVKKRIHICLLKEISPNTKELVSSYALEWRRLLGSKTGGASLTLDLTGFGPTAGVKMPAGKLEIRLDLVPNEIVQKRPDEPASPTTEERLTTHEVTEMLNREAKLDAQAHRRFCDYARVWWQEYIETNTAFRNRLVKIFAENESGDHEAACVFLQPLRAGRLIDTPHHAARFVSLIPFAREEAVGGGRMEVWHSPHSFLSKGRGDCEDHALLLCSLLLGFGLQAYVCIGTVQEEDDEFERDHVWVASLAGRENRSCTFWESLTGHRIDITGPRAAVNKLSRSYKRIGCMFNHASFFANKQLDDRVISCNFDVSNDLYWKSMDERLIEPLKRMHALPLLPCKLDTISVANEIENSLRGLIAVERAEHYSLTTSWDDDLSFFLAPALTAYETERVTGTLFGNSDFQAVVKRHIPKGHSFKGYPTMFNHCNPERIMHAIRRSPIAKDILKIRADHTHFALRVKLVPFPENVVALWVMLCVRFRAS